MAAKQEMQDTVARALCRDNDLEPCEFCTVQARLAVAALVLAGYIRLDIEDLIEASSLGTPEAKALRDSVTDEQAQRAIDIANRIRSRSIRISRSGRYCGAPIGETSRCQNDAPCAAHSGHELWLTSDDLDHAAAADAVPPKTDGGVVEPPATRRAVSCPAAQAGEAGWRPAPSSLPRRFEMYRHRDITGLSGTGVVAWGVLWPDGTVSLRWAGVTPSFSNWDSLDVLIAVHGHEGATELRWLDGVTEAAQ